MFDDRTRIFWFMIEYILPAEFDKESWILVKLLVLHVTKRPAQIALATTM